MNPACYNPTREQDQVSADHILFWAGFPELDLVGDYSTTDRIQKNCKAHPLQTNAGYCPRLSQLGCRDGWCPN